jgi:hypothetical protein
MDMDMTSAETKSTSLNEANNERFFRMTRIVLEMISAREMGVARIVYNAVKSFSQFLGERPHEKDDCWLRTAFICGEILRKVNAKSL